MSTPKPLTEDDCRKALEGNDWWSMGSGEHQNIAECLLDALDAARAEVAELAEEVRAARTYYDARGNDFRSEFERYRALVERNEAAGLPRVSQ